MKDSDIIKALECCSTDADKIDFSPLKGDFDRARAKVIIMGQPTADVVEVKHGIWVINPDGYYPYCNQCGYEPRRPLGDYDNRTPYCPNCGAKMRKEWEK